MATTTTKTKTKTDRMHDLLRANGVHEDVLKHWSEMSAKVDAMALPDGDNTMRIANYVGWQDPSEMDREFLSITSPGDVKDFLEANAGGDVTFLINTPGGSVFGGVEISNMIIGHEGKTTAIVTGLAASVGSLITAACDDVQMMEASMAMIHGPRTFAMGTANDFRDVADRLDKEVDIVSTIYKRRMEGDTVDGMLTDDGDHYITPSEAIENGFADSVYKEASDDNDGDTKGDDTAQINTDDHMESEERKRLAKVNSDRLSFLATGMLT